MAISEINIGKTEISFVFRHRFEKATTPEEEFNKDMDWRCWELGLWYKKYKVLGKRDFNKPIGNLIPMYMFGINLLICQAWFSICRGLMNISEE
jgi:hypothetical protein